MKQFIKILLGLLIASFIAFGVKSVYFRFTKPVVSKAVRDPNYLANRPRSELIELIYDMQDLLTTSQLADLALMRIRQAQKVINEEWKPVMELNATLTQEAKKYPDLKIYLEKLESQNNKFNELIVDKNLERNRKSGLIDEWSNEQKSVWNNFIEKAAEYPDLKIIIDKINAAAQSVKSSTTE